MQKLIKLYTNLGLFFFRAAQKFRKKYQPVPALGINAPANREERHKVRLAAIKGHIECP